MTARARTQLIALGVLIAAIVVMAYVQSGDPPAEAGGNASNRRGSGASAGRVEVPVVDLRLDRLTAERDDPGDPERNPFRFRPAPTPPPAPRAETRPAAPQVFAAPPPTGPPPPPPIPLKYFGSADTQGTRIAWFSDARGNVVQGKEGDIIEGRYRVLRIGADSADLAYINGSGRQTIRLTGDK
jgi:hypothetical protein